MTHPDSPAPTDARLRVLVVDADDRVRESLAGLLAIGERVVVVGSAGQPAAAIELIETARPDLVLVDPRLPDVDDGTAFIRRLRELHPDIRILAMSWSERLETERVDCGADGSVRKTFRPAELVAAILGTIPRAIA